MAMKFSHSSGSFRPFENLEKLIHSGSIKLSTPPATPDRRNQRRTKHAQQRQLSTKPKNAAKSATPSDKDLFHEAMVDVKPISGQRRKIAGIGRSGENGRLSTVSNPENDGESGIVSQLHRLVQHGDGFIVENTPEYKEWTGFNVNPWITQRLHRGEFTIQEYIDLHGLGVYEAKLAFEAFLKGAVMTGRQAVLIVHGRGLSSPNEPVLKSRVYDWLTSGMWNKWVIAFSSARLCDGGAGATYVLLRRRPLPKRFRKKQAQNSLDK